MKGDLMQNPASQLMPLVLGLACAGITATVLSGRSLPLISGPRPALIALLVLGMAACAAGIGQVAVSGRWFGPLAILGYLLGAAILLVVVSVFAGWKLPLIATDTQAVLAVALLMAAKFFIGTAGFFLRWL